MKTRLSHLFTDPDVRAAFWRAEQDQEPDAFAVPVTPPVKPLVGTSGWRATPYRGERATCEA